MAHRNSKSSNQSDSKHNFWAPGQAYLLAVITLVLGFATGYLFRGSGQPPAPTITSSSSQETSIPSPEPTVGPMLRQLQQTPRDAALLAQIGNTYYDARNYTQAIEYYRRSLEIRPENVNVRTDLATATWYNGDADGALKEFDRSLQYDPTHSHTLFNVGIVKWKGKNDIQGALASWNKLLATNPNYSDRPKVLQLMEQLKSGGA